MEDETFGGYLKRRNEELRTASSCPQATAFPPEASMSSEMSKSPKKPGQNAAGQEEGTEKCANEALLVEQTELTRNDDGQGLADCPEKSALMELKRPNLDLKVSDKSENPASDDSQGGDVSGKQTSLTEPMTRKADQEPEQKLDALEEQAAKGTTSVDEPGTDSPGEELDADNSDEVLNSGSGKSLCSIKSDRGGKITIEMEKEAAHGMLEMKYYIPAYLCRRTEKSGNEAPVVEEEELSRKHSREALADCPEKSAVIEVERKKPKLDHEVLDNSVVMQEEKQKVYLDAPAPSNSSEEESSDIIDGEANRTT